MRTLSAAFLVAVVALAGCSTENPWSDSFRSASGGPTPSLPEGAPVVVRVVDMNQVREASAAARGYLEGRGIAPEDVLPDDEEALRRVHFEAFRFREDPAQYEYVGHSAMTADQPVNRDDGAIAEAARDRGANLVFLASEYVGRGTEYRDTPVWSYSTGSVSWRDEDGDRRSDLVNRSTTTWVPVPVEVDRYSNLAMFYRRVR